MDPVLAEWKRFTSGQSVIGHVRPVILQSWGRSRIAGAAYASLQPRQVSPEAFQQRLRTNSELLLAATPQLDWLRTSFSILPEVPHAIYITDCEGVLLRVYGNIPGIAERPETLPGADWSEQSVGTNAIGTAIAIRQPVAVLGAEHFSRKTHSYACCAAPIYDADSNVVGAVGITTPLAFANSNGLTVVTQAAKDIRERLVFRQAVRHTESIRLVSRLSSFMAHELSNPLAALTGSLALLSRRKIDDKAMELVIGCQRLAGQMTELVRELRALGGAQPTDEKQINVADLVKDVVASLHRSEAHRLELQVDKVLTVCGNPTLLHLAITNLVRNAIEAMPEGGAVEISARRMGALVRIAVSDTGPGVPAALRRQLFAGSVTTKEKGSGLGLLLVRAIVENAHGGKVSYAPNKPRGSRFNIDLPRQVTEEVAAATGEA